MNIDPENLDPEFVEKLQARVDMINLLEDRYAKGEDIGPLLDLVDDVRHARGLVMALITMRARDREKLRALLREWEERKRQYEMTEEQFRAHVAADMKETLQTPDLATARQEIAELKEIVRGQEETIRGLRAILGMDPN